MVHAYSNPTTFTSTNLSLIEKESNKILQILLFYFLSLIHLSLLLIWLPTNMAEAGAQAIPSAARVAVSGEQNSPHGKCRVSCIDRASDLAGGRGIDALPAKSECSNHAYSQRAERNISPRRPSVAADWITR